MTGEMHSAMTHLSIDMYGYTNALVDTNLGMDIKAYINVILDALCH